MLDRRRCSWEKGLLLFFSLCSIFFSLSLFLTPYLTFTGRSRGYQKPFQLFLPHEEFVYQLSTATCDINPFSKDIVALELLVHTEPVNHICPSGFSNSTFHRRNSSLPECFQSHCSHLHYLAFERDGSLSKRDYSGPQEMSQSVAIISSSLKSLKGQSSHFRTGVWIELRVHNFGSSRKSCHADNDCHEFCVALSSKFMKGPTIFKTPPGICVTEGDSCYSIKSGCSCLLDFDVYDKCGGMFSHYDSVRCAYVVSYMVFPPIISFLRSWSMWTSEIVVFVGIFSFWLFIALAIGYRLHRLYLDYFYVRSRLFRIMKDEQYQVKIIVTGPKFTRCNGLFTVRLGHTIIFKERINAIFEESDIGDMAQVTFRMSFFSCVEGSASFGVSWVDQFHRADFIAPHVQVVLRRSIPYSVKTRGNVILMPLLALWRYILGVGRDGDENSNYSRLLLAYLSAANFSWVVLVFYNLVLYGTHGTIMWGDLYTRPVLPIIFMILFVAAVLSCFVLSLFVPRRDELPLESEFDQLYVKDRHAVVLPCPTLTTAKSNINEWDVEYIELK